VGNNAIADPISDAQKKLTQLEAQRSALEDDYNDSRTRLAAAKEQQTQLEADIIQQQATLDALMPTIVWMVTLERQTAGVNMTANFLLDNTEEGFLTQMSTVAAVSGIIDEQVARFISEQQRLDELKASLDSTIAAIAAEVKTGEKLLTEARLKEAAQQGLINRLTEAQRAALAARNNDDGGGGGGGGGGGKKPKPPPSPPQGSASDRAMKVVNYALKQNGKRYVYGASGPNAFDCSGLAMASYSKVGIRLPHSARQQSKYGRSVSRSNLLPGDLVFFYSPISHVGIYIGGGKYIHASTPSTGVKISTLNASFNTARRLV